MIFSEVLEKLVGKVNGTYGAVIMGIDGISVEKFQKYPDREIETSIIEYTNIYKNIQNTTNELSMGTVKEISIAAENTTILIRSINNDYFLALMIDPEGNVGRGKFELRKVISQIENEF